MAFELHHSGSQGMDEWSQFYVGMSIHSRPNSDLGNLC